MHGDFHENRVGNLNPGEHSQPGYYLKQLGDGAVVYDVDGRPVGTMNVRETSDYLVIQAPDLSEGVLYVPLSAINRSGPDGIYLSLSRADLTGEQWRVPPIPR